MPEPVSDALLPAGAMLYAGIGVVSMLVGGAFLQYGSLALGGGKEAEHAAHHYGLIGIELGVTITVAGAMVTLFFEMARPKLYLDLPRRRREDRTEQERR
jgi:multicomponent Na+:H+ antiporter subunit B